jgi:hypothetical protein
MSGGIIIRQRSVILAAAKDSSLYDNLPANEKSKVDAIDAKPPDQCTLKDLETLVHVLGRAIHC